MKVLYFLGALNIGGMESLILDICNNSTYAPYNITILYRKDGSLSKAYKNSGVKLVNIKKKSIIKYILDVRKLVIEENFDIIHSQTPSNTILLFLALFGYSKPKIVTTLHGYPFADSCFLFRRIVYSFSDHIFCVSNCQASHYIRKWHLPEHNKIAVVYNGIDFSKLDKHDDLSTTLPQIKNGYKVAMVGSFRSGRDHIHVIKSIDYLQAKSNLNFDFYFVGRKDNAEPERYDECVDYCGRNHLDNIHFLGDRGDVPALLDKMDGFVYCSEHDTFGIALIEAAACGLPLVINDWMVFKEIFQIEGCEDLPIYYETGSVESCAKAISQLIESMDASKNKAMRAKKLIRETYSIQSHIDRIAELYNKII